ncbi:MAG: single-stranded-DNA-specific exonuclease RecJ [Firmicutes bacterium]|nr:single-stranded-DNA-specific exonuclease RecJ [Bacillota bacterium]
MYKPVKVWQVFPERPEETRLISRELDISPVVAQVMVNRGIVDVEAAKAFLYGSAELLASPWLLCGMEESVNRIQYAISEQQKIVVYGDYDVDGITSTALVYRVLTRLGAMVEFYIPERQSEGYGLNKDALEKLYNAGAGLIITVDCGISGVDEVATMAGRLDIIITDHHQPPQILPSAVAIINPKLPECKYPDKNLAGVGVAFKLCQALWQRFHDTDALFMDYLDLVAVGTIADIAPVIGENRVLVKLGLEKLAESPVLGLKTMAEAASIALQDIDAGKIGFVIGPRLNAAGRISHASNGVELLITQDMDAARTIAAELEEENVCRQAIEKAVLAEAEEKLANIDIAQEKVIVLAGDNWHTGVIGIVASRLVEKYYRPVIMIGLRDGIGKGSCRSIPGFDIYQALTECSDVLLQYGGHTLAAGLSVVEAAIDALRQKLNALATLWLTEKDYQPVVKIDAKVAMREINAAFIEQLSCLAPHGMGNPSPVFSTNSAAVVEARAMGKEGQHLRLKVKQKSDVLEAVAWNMGQLAPELKNGTAVELAFFPEYNEWQGRRKLQLKARDVVIDKVVPDHLDLLDSRDVRNKLEYCLNLMADGQMVAVVVDSARQAAKLAYQLKLMAPAKKRKIGYYHEKMPVRRQESIKLRYGELGLVVVAEETWDFSGVADYCLYNPPISQRSFAKFCVGALKNYQLLKVHFLFNVNDLELFQTEIAKVIPDRMAVGYVYLFLKEVTKSGKSILCSDNQIAAKLCQAGRCSITKDGVAAALKILEELNLLEIDYLATKRNFRLLPAPKEKLDLETALTYQRGMVIRASKNKFAKILATRPVVELWRQAVEFEEAEEITDGMGQFNSKCL